jgi:hypothetical protein
MARCAVEHVSAYTVDVDLITKNTPFGLDFDDAGSTAHQDRKLVDIKGAWHQFLS